MEETGLGNGGRTWFYPPAIGTLEEEIILLVIPGTGGC
jgi:hypothetical protein